MKNYMHDIIINDIALKILREVYKEGEQLPKEDVLCQEFNLSRTSVRAGLHSLRNMGLIVTRPKSGTFVAPQECWKVLDDSLLKIAENFNIPLFKMREIETFRRVLEPNIAAIAAQNSTLEDIHIMEQAVAVMMENCGDDNIKNYNDADLLFHTALIKSTHNSIFLHLEPTLRAAVSSSIKITTPLDSSAERLQAAEKHIELINAIRIKDADLARYLMTQMILDSSRRAILLGS